MANGNNIDNKKATISLPLKPKFQARRLAFNIVEDFISPTVILPPLYMHINPSTFSMSFQKKINRTQTFDAFLEEYWGEELDTITSSGSTGGFILPDTGLTNVHKTETEPYFKFQDLIDLYRNNGNVYDEVGRVVRKGHIVLSFDKGTYFGYFESFNYTEDADIPYRFVFDFTYKVEKSYMGI